MVQTRILLELDKLLKKNKERYFLDYSLNKARVIEDLHNYDPNLISLLSENEKIKKEFIITIKRNQIIKINELIEIFEMNEYWDDSYTAYENKIGLTSHGIFLSDHTDVVLNFPYKDTVLKASMSKEDREDLVVDELFLNEKMARKEIDRLFDNKVFVQARKYDQEGSHEAKEFSEEDNLILKGNNLLALHTLASRYKGKIKMIYIDPPYNTGSDSFEYNDRFNHSSWLVFMKNRLEIARTLLTKDGSIWININDDESHYLKVLLDELFGRENFMSNIIWKKKYSPQNDDNYFSDMHDHILVYAKDKSQFEINGLPRTSQMDSRYTNRDKDPRGAWKPGDLSVPRITEKDRYPIATPSGRIVYPTSGRSWGLSKEKFQEALQDNRIWFGEKGDFVPAVKRFLTEVKQSSTPQTIWDYDEVGHNQEAIQHLNKLFGKSVFTTPKPEKLLRRMIHIGSNEGDIVLDFFMGSATTQAVAHKMNRRYIGIEQMEYIEKVSVPRLQKVIEGEQGGISQDVEWKSGGSFVYAKLLEKNAGYLKDVLKAENTADLRNIFHSMIHHADFDFRVNLEEVKASVWQLPLEDQKRTLVKMIDKNQLYYNYSEIDDKNVRHLISESDYAFNKSFYQQTGEADE